MIDLLLTIIVFAIVGGLIWYLITLLPLPEPFAMILRVCVILLFVVLLLGMLFGGVSLPSLNLRR